MTISPALFPAVTVTVVRDRKIRTELRTNQIAGFVTVPSWKKNNVKYLICAPLILMSLIKTYESAIPLEHEPVTKGCANSDTLQDT